MQAGVAGKAHRYNLRLDSRLSQVSRHQGLAHELVKRTLEWATCNAAKSYQVNSRFLHVFPVTPRSGWHSTAQQADLLWRGIFPDVKPKASCLFGCRCIIESRAAAIDPLGVFSLNQRGVLLPILIFPEYCRVDAGAILAAFSSRRLAQPGCDLFGTGVLELQAGHLLEDGEK